MELGRLQLFLIYSRLFFGFIGITLIGLSILWMGSDIASDLTYLGYTSFDVQISNTLYLVVMCIASVAIIGIIAVKFLKRI